MKIDVVFKTDFNTLTEIAKTLLKEQVQPMLITIPSIIIPIPEGELVGSEFNIKNEDITVLSDNDQMFVLSNEPFLDKNYFYNVAIVEDSVRRSVLLTTSNAIHCLSQKYSNSMNLSDYGRDPQSDQEYPTEILDRLDNIIDIIYKDQVEFYKDTSSSDRLVALINMDHDYIAIDQGQSIDPENHKAMIYATFSVRQTGLKTEKDNIRSITQLYTTPKTEDK